MKTVLLCALLCLTGRRAAAFHATVRWGLRHARRHQHPRACCQCGRGMRHGNPALPTSSGICRPCSTAVLHAARAWAGVPAA